MSEWVYTCTCTCSTCILFVKKHVPRSKPVACAYVYNPRNISLVHVFDNVHVHYYNTGEPLRLRLPSMLVSVVVMV